MMTKRDVTLRINVNPRSLYHQPTRALEEVLEPRLAGERAPIGLAVVDPVDRAVEQRARADPALREGGDGVACAPLAGEGEEGWGLAERVLPGGDSLVDQYVGLLLRPVGDEGEGREKRGLGGVGRMSVWVSGDISRKEQGSMRIYMESEARERYGASGKGWWEGEGGPPGSSPRTRGALRRGRGGARRAYQG